MKNALVELSNGLVAKVTFQWADATALDPIKQVAATIREAHGKAVEALNNSGMALTYDETKKMLQKAIYEEPLFQVSTEPRIQNVAILSECYPIGAQILTGDDLHKIMASLDAAPSKVYLPRAVRIALCVLLHTDVKEYDETSEGQFFFNYGPRFLSEPDPLKA